MNLRQITYLLAVVEEGSFTRAAQRLSVAQPSLSQQIRALERELGGPLLERLPNGVQLTAAGRAFLPEARAAASHAARAAEAARTTLGAPGRQLELATVTSMAVGILPDALARWHRRHADTAVYLHEFRHRRELHEAVRGGLGDLGIGPRPASWTGPITRLVVGIGTDARSSVGPLIDRPAFDKVSRHVADALAQGIGRTIAENRRLRPDHQHGLGHAVQGRPLPAALRLQQGRGGRDDQGAGQGAGCRQHPRQHRRAGLHDVRRVLANDAQVQQMQEVSAKARVLVRDQYPEGIVGAVAFFAGDGAAFITGQSLVVDGGRTSTEGSHMELQVLEYNLAQNESASLHATPRILYRIDQPRADYSGGPLTLSGPVHVLSFELVAQASRAAKLSAPVDVDGDRLIRLDTVAFPPGGAAYLHVHRGPGIRVLLEGEIRIDTDGQSHSYGPLEAWFEAGPVPVFAAASESVPTAFVRCMVLPAELKGKRSLRYLRDEDAGKPKLQEYRIFVEELLSDAAVAR